MTPTVGWLLASASLNRARAAAGLPIDSEAGFVAAQVAFDEALKRLSPRIANAPAERPPEGM